MMLANLDKIETAVTELIKQAKKLPNELTTQNRHPSKCMEEVIYNKLPIWEMN